MLSNASILDRSPGSSVLDMIGRTPLVRLHQFERETPGVELYAKAEWQNPGGSVKDRAAARMMRVCSCCVSVLFRIAAGIPICARCAA